VESPHHDSLLTGQICDNLEKLQIKAVVRIHVIKVSLYIKRNAETAIGVEHMTSKT